MMKMKMTMNLEHRFNEIYIILCGTTYYVGGGVRAHTPPVAQKRKLLSTLLATEQAA